MGFYSDDSLAVLCQQILRDNPELPYPLTKDNVFVLGVPSTTGLGDSGRNTRIALNGKLGAGFSGRRYFFYDRLNLAQMFRGVLVNIVVPYRATKVRDIVDLVSEASGVNLTADDLNTPDAVFGAITVNSGTSSIVVAPSNPAFYGSITVAWTRMMPGFDDLYTETDTDVWESPDVYSLIYGLDWTNYVTQVVNVQQYVALTPNSAGAQALVSAMRAWSGIPFTLVAGEPYSLNGYIATRDNRPGLNPDMRPEFNICFKLTPPNEPGMLRRPFYLHLNRKDNKKYLAQEADLLRYAKWMGYPTPIYTGPITDNSGKMVLAKTKKYASGDTLMGSPYATYAMGNVTWPRFQQHGYSTEAAYNYAAERGLLTMILCTLMTFASTTAPSVARNGYTSLAATSTQGWRCTQFVYYDNAQGGYMTWNPWASSAPVAWYPPL